MTPRAGHRVHARVVRAAVAGALAALSVTGCAVGERPGFADAPTAVGDMTGDPLIDEVLQRLDRVGSARFNAQYTAVQAMGGTTSTVRVAHESATRHSVTIGDVRFLTDGSDTKTCDLSTAVCEPGILPQRISDTGLLTPEVVLGGLAKRLRLDATAKVGPSSATSVEIAGEQASCVDVPLSPGTARYCVLADGTVARYVGGDFSLDLVSYSNIPDVTLFQETRNT